MRKNKDVIVFDAIKNKNKIHLSIVATDDKGNEYIMWIQLMAKIRMQYFMNTKEHCLDLLVLH